MRELPGGRSKDFAFSLILDLYEIEAKYTAELYDGIGLTEGGVWRFDMVAADGTRYSNRMTFLILDRPHRIEVEHGAVRDDDPGRFRMLVTFDAQSDGKTVLTLRQMHPSRAQRQATIGFGAVEYGAQTLDKLARHLAAREARAGA